jgi:hypothetical protein
VIEETTVNEQWNTIREQCCIHGKHMPFRDQAAWNERVDHLALAEG